MNIDYFNSKTTFDDVFKSGISNDLNVIKFVRKYLTDKLIGNMTYDEIFILIIGTLTSITIFFKHYNTISNITNDKSNLNDTIEELNYGIIFIQNIILITYAFYIINMMLNGKEHFIITRYSMLLNYGITIITLTVFLCRSYVK